MEQQEPVPPSKMHGAHMAVLFLITAPVMGWATGMAWGFFRAGGLFSEMLGPAAFIGVLMGLALLVLPVLCVAGLAAAWRDLGRDRVWLVRNSPVAIVGVFILTVVATVTA